MNQSRRPKKPPKDVNVVDRIYFFRAFFLFARWGLIVLPLFVYVYGLLGLILWVLICLTLAVIVEFVSDRIGLFASRLYRGGKGHWSVREQMQGDMDIVQVQKSAGNYEVALIKVDEILAKDPTYNEAIYAKAQILYEGYNERSEALRWLQKIVDTATPDQTVYQWAVTYMGEIRTDRKG